ncbi:hypothetical protein D3C85_1797570 [compost metagenome]
MDIPNSPKKPAKTINGKRSSLSVSAIFAFGIMDAAIPVIDVTMTIGAETIPA